MDINTPAHSTATARIMASPASYLNVAEHWIEDDTFASLDEPMRTRLRTEVRRRLERLHPDALVWRRPLVSVVGTRPR